MSIWRLYRCKRHKSAFCMLMILTALGILIVCELFSQFGTTISDRQIKQCILGKQDPWDISLKPYITPPRPLLCSDRKQLMYVDDDGYVHFNKAMLVQYSLTSLECVYQIVLRVDGDNKVTFEPEVPFVPPIFINGHVFRVMCKDASAKRVYDYLHLNLLWNASVTREREIGTEDEDNLSLIVIGIDSVSRAHALRNLPKSYSYLLKEFEAYDFEGYSKVGENTWPNLVPLLAGQSHRNFPIVNTLHVHVDSMPLLWYEKEAKRYATFFAEDRPDISTFNFVKGGFRKSPTDYFFRPYTLAMHSFEPVIVEPLGRANFDCFGNSNYFELQLDYLKGFMKKYKKKQKFVYFWNNQVGHEDFTTLSRGDEPLLDFLKWMKYTDQTRNAIVAVLSDHGYRIGGASLTHAGRAENNRPLLMLHIPKHIRQKYDWIHEAVTTNTQRLVSHYDMYQTMLDLLQGKAFVNTPPSLVMQQLVRRNIFTPIPIHRTCLDAGIEDKYCACSETHNVSIQTTLVSKIAHFIVAGINSILLKHQHICSTLTLHNVTEATVAYSNSDESNVPPHEPNSFINNFVKIFAEPKLDTTGRYVLLLHTVPGLAYFEGTVDYAQVSPDGLKDHMTMVGEPSRLDRYGNQSQCVDDSFLRLFCYCKNFVQ